MRSSAVREGEKKKTGSGSRSGSHPGLLYPIGVCGQCAGHAGCRVHRPTDVGGREKGPAHQVGPHLT